MPPQSPFHSVINLPHDYKVLDLSQSDVSASLLGQNAVLSRGQDDAQYTVGRYNEARPAIYTQDLFHRQGGGDRHIHMGIDIGAPALCPVFSFDRGVVYAQGVLPAQGDYGHSIIIEYVWAFDWPLSSASVELVKGDHYWALYGHLSARSLELHQVGDIVGAGAMIGELGEPNENGGWPPHLHFQLSVEKPNSHDLPGVVSPQDRAKALELYPDPRQVLGFLY